jgi:aminoglycoside phosphotransferase (APT) family kinase protein
VIETELQLGTTTSIVDSSKGCDQAVWLVSTATGTFVVKQPSSEPLKVVNECHLCTVASTIGIPVPRIIFQTTTFFLVQTFVVGTQVGPMEDSSRPLAVYRALGAHLRRLHSLRAPGFGELGKSSFSSLVQRHDNYHPGELEALLLHLTARERRITQQYFAEGRKIFLENDARAPVLLHGDISDDNFVSDDASGTVSGIIDWADSAGGVPEEEFCVALAANMHPVHYDAMVAGYGRDALNQHQIDYFAALRLTWVVPHALVSLEPAEQEVCQGTDRKGLHGCTRQKVAMFRKLVGL